MIEQPTPATVSLARGGSDDLDDIVTVMNAAFDPQFGEAWTRSQCAGILPMPGVRLTVAREEGRGVIGFSLSRTIRDEAELLLIAVQPSNRRRGVGLVLLNDFLETARQAGATRLHLEVRDGNPAIAMYRRAEFMLAGRRRKYYRGKNGEEFDALTLVHSASTAL